MGSLLDAIVCGEEVDGKECSGSCRCSGLGGPESFVSRDWSLGCPMGQTMLYGMGWLCWDLCCTLLVGCDQNRSAAGTAPWLLLALC